MLARRCLAGFLIVLLVPCLACSASPGKALVLALGDSVTAGYGLSPEQAYPVALQELLTHAGHPAEVLNAGVSGDTTFGGLARLPGYYPPQASRSPDLLIIALGANDAIQRLDLDAVEANLDAIIVYGKKQGSKILLAGIGAGLKRDDTYRNDFEGIFRRLAIKHGVTLFPRIGDGVRGNPQMVQADGAHPNAVGARIIASSLLPLVLGLLR